MGINLSKKTILNLIVLVWVVFSISYIVWDLWGDFRNFQIFQAYEQGGVDMINVLIEEAEKCEPVEVRSAERQISVISIDCLTEAD